MVDPKLELILPVSIAGTELHQLRSTHTGRHYDIYVGLPVDYAGSSKLLPVLYVLDGQWDFKLVMSIFGALRVDMFVPDMIVVGISYSGEQPNYDALRASDYTPTHVADERDSGQARQFLSFLIEELVPFIETRYRADPADRALAGSSLGGLFGLYTLFQEPDLFQRCVCVSPAISWDREAIFRSEETHFTHRRDLPVRLFLAAGGSESARWMLEPVSRMAVRLRERRYEQLELTELTIPGERHAGVKAEAFTRGLRAVFTEAAVDLPAGVLEGYVGSYQDVDEETERVLDFELRGTQLFLSGNSDTIEGDELVPISSSRFRFRVSPAEITFQRSQSGEVEGATLHLAHLDQQLKRMN